ncbi:MAG: peptidylprolyl isomerase [Candidatus Fermentibacteraceae bacterium]|nr:peptidylprolyl isomerase [Candidatus Fermentibacteraceae bacterium]
MSLMILAALVAGFVPLERTVAVVEDNPILHSQVMELLAGMGIAPEGDFETVSGTPGYREALQELVENRLLVQAGIDAGYYPADEEIQALVTEELENNPDMASLDPVYLSRYLAENQAAQVFLGRKIQAAFSEMPMSPETFLAANADLVEEIVMPRGVSWIYLPVLPSGPEYQSAVEELLALRARIMAGESFEELAMEYSDDGSAAGGGYLGTFGPGEMTFAFEDAAFALEPGEVSQPVSTPFGVHLIRLDSREDDGRISASHILRVVPVDSTDIQDTVVEAWGIIGGIETGELSFEEAASLYSLDRTSASSGGDMGVVPLRLWLPAVALGIEDLAPGRCSDPIILAEAGAVVIVQLHENTGRVDWSSYTPAELNGLVQQVIYQDTYYEMVDSLMDEIPVVFLLEDDGAIED